MWEINITLQIRRYNMGSKHLNLNIARVILIFTFPNLIGYKQIINFKLNQSHNQSLIIILGKSMHNLIKQLLINSIQRFPHIPLTNWIIANNKISHVCHMSTERITNKEKRENKEGVMIFNKKILKGTLFIWNTGIIYMTR